MARDLFLTVVCVLGVCVCMGVGCAYVCVRLKYSPVAWRGELMFLISFQRFSLVASTARFYYYLLNLFIFTAAFDVQLRRRISIRIRVEIYIMER